MSKNSRNKKADTTAETRDRKTNGARTDDNQLHEVDTSVRHERASSVTKGRTFSEHNKKK